MEISSNISLKPYNTFGIEATAKHFVDVNSVADIQDVLSNKKYTEKLIIGGGSNMLLTKNIDALVIHINLKGIEIVDEHENNVFVKANAGENWHEFVLYCIENDFGGIENLSLIPGNVGAAPIQNIGAYGVELKDTFYSCDALEIKTNTINTFYFDDCKFDYRESIFKQELKGKYIITSVTLRLSKKNHQLHTGYGPIITELQHLNITQPKIKDVSNAVINIRESKLPDPKKIGNSGSFFKNPIVQKSLYDNLKINFPEMPCYPIDEAQVKIPAGWLIEKAGFKGKNLGSYGVHKKQALVLVNYGGAEGSDIFSLAQLIQKTIYRIFKVQIETEVNIL